VRSNSTEATQRQAAWLWTSQSHEPLKLDNIMWEKRNWENQCSQNPPWLTQQHVLT